MRNMSGRKNDLYRYINDGHIGWSDSGLLFRRLSRNKHESGLGFYLPFCVLYILQCSLIYEKYNFLGIFLLFSAFRILNKDHWYDGLEVSR